MPKDGLGLTYEQATQYQLDARIIKAHDLSDVLFRAGWTPESVISPETWIQALIASNHARLLKRLSTRRLKLPSKETIDITLRLLARRYADRLNVREEMLQEDIAATRAAEELYEKQQAKKARTKEREKQRRIARKEQAYEG